MPAGHAGIRFGGQDQVAKPSPQVSVAGSVKPEMAFWLTWRFRASTVAGDNGNESATTTPKTTLSDESQQQIEQLAREQQREPGEVLEEAVRRYAVACRLERFADKMGQRARDKGIREEDVPRLVEEVRRENAERGR